MDRSSGETLWTFSSGGPLVQAHRSGADGSGRARHGRGRDTRTDEPDGVPRNRRQPLRVRRRRSLRGRVGVRRPSRRGVEIARHREAARGGFALRHQGRRGGHGHAPERGVRGGQAHRRTPQELRHGRDGGARGKRRGVLPVKRPNRRRAGADPRRVLHRQDRVRGPIGGQLDGPGALERDVRRGHAADVDRGRRRGRRRAAVPAPRRRRRSRHSWRRRGRRIGRIAAEARVGSRERRARVVRRRVVVRRRRATPAWIAHMPSTPVAAYDGRTGRVVKGGSPFEGGGGDILVGAHGGGLFALPSTDGGSARGLSLQPPGDSSLGTVGALVPVAVSPTASDDDWACIPEKLWDDALTPGGLDSFLALHGGGARPSTDGSRYLLTPLQRVMGSPVGAAGVVTVAVGFGTFASHAASIARGKRRGGSNGGSNGSKRGSRGKNRGRRNKGKGGAGGGAGRGGDDAIDDEAADEVPRMANRGDSGGFPGASPEPLRATPARFASAVSASARGSSATVRAGR